MKTLGREEFFVLIRQMRPLLIILICWAHVPFLQGFYGDGVDASSARTVFGVLLRDVVSRGGVPILTVISGYLAYLSFNRKPYSTFLADKFRRILVPYLAWNVICLVYLWWLFHAYDYVVDAELIEIQGMADFARKVIAINRMPINPPIYFLRDLFLIFLVCPVFDLLSRNIYIAGAALGLFAVYMLNTITPGTADYAVLYRSDMPFFFLLGYMASRHDIRLPLLSGVQIALGFVLLAVVSWAIAYYLAYSKPDLLAYLEYRPLLGVLYLLALPCMTGLLYACSGGMLDKFLVALSGYSMVIFLSHQLWVYALGLFMPTMGVDMGNHVNMGGQLTFLLFYTVGCILVGVVLKTLYKGSISLGGRGCKLLSPR